MGEKIEISKKRKTLQKKVLKVLLNEKQEDGRAKSAHRALKPPVNTQFAQGDVIHEYQWPSPKK